MKKLMLVFALCLGCVAQNSNALEVKVSGNGAAAWSAPVIGLGVGAYKVFTWFFDPNRVLTAAGKEAAILALQHIPPPTNATVAADALIACNVILFWLPANKEQTIDAINLYITQQFIGANPIFVTFLQQVAATLERYIPVGSSFLNDTTMQLLVSFISGVKDGIISWQENPAVSVKIKYTTEKQKAHEFKKMKFARAAHGWFNPEVFTGTECDPCK